jgi:hypothetical protein
MRDPPQRRRTSANPSERTGRDAAAARCLRTGGKGVEPVAPRQAATASAETTRARSGAASADSTEKPDRAGRILESRSSARSGWPPSDHLAHSKRCRRTYVGESPASNAGNSCETPGRAPSRVRKRAASRLRFRGPVIPRPSHGHGAVGARSVPGPEGARGPGHRPARRHRRQGAAGSVCLGRRQHLHNVHSTNLVLGLSAVGINGSAPDTAAHPAPTSRPARQQPLCPLGKTVTSRQGPTHGHLRGCASAWQHPGT